MSRRHFLFLAGLLFGAVGALADPLSKRTDLDFFREVPSRNLKGLATRSDGRLVAGPSLTELSGTAPADLLWCIEPTPDRSKFLVGTGPDGRIAEVTIDAQAGTYTSREVATVPEPQVFAVKRLSDGSLLVGTSPKGALYLIRDGKPVARAMLPVDSIFDLLIVDANTVLAATGNPGRIYRIDVQKFAASGIVADKMTDTKILADRGITTFGEIHDRNVRRIATFEDGRVVAGSAPKGNVYVFPRAGGAPVILQENHEAEVTDLLPQRNGDLYATIVFSASSGESRLSSSGSRAAAAAKPRERDRDREPDSPDASASSPTLATPPTERFGGRSTAVWFPANGYPETLTSRSGAAFYRVARLNGTLVIAGGDTGELLGFDLNARLALTFAGSNSAQLNGLLPVPGAPGQFVVLRNNAPGFSLLDFGPARGREAETRRIDLTLPSQLGAVRFTRLRNIGERDITVEAKVSIGSDETEGWGPWTPMTLDPDGGWRAANLRGRYAKLRIRVVSSSPSNNPSSGASAKLELAGLEIDRGALYSLPQNRRPQLQDFRVLSPGYGLVVAADQPPSPIVTLNQLLQPSSHDDDKRKGSFTSSQVVPQPGAQVVLWTIVDPDGDNFTSTFSIRRSKDDPWIDVVANTHDSYAQFDTSHLPDGIYFTRLVATETSPRPPNERLTQTFETDDLVLDHTPPEILGATARRVGDAVVVTIHGRDQLSLLDSIDVTFNNGVHETVEQPGDGIRDGREETFSLEVPIARISNANSVQVLLYDVAGNSTARRLMW